MTAEQIRDENKAIEEAEALNKAGRRERPKRLRFITGSYNEQEFEKLFKTDKYHDEE